MPLGCALKSSNKLDFDHSDICSPRSQRSNSACAAPHQSARRTDATSGSHPLAKKREGRGSGFTGTGSMAHFLSLCFLFGRLCLYAFVFVLPLNSPGHTFETSQILSGAIKYTKSAFPKCEIHKLSHGCNHVFSNQQDLGHGPVKGHSTRRRTAVLLRPSISLLVSLYWQPQS